MTEDSLKSAFASESQAHVRYWIFAKRAEAERLPHVANLLKAISYAARTQVHATEHYDALGMIRGSGDNLQVAIDGETYEIKETYPAFFGVAQLQKKGAMQTLDAAHQAEKVHAPESKADCRNTQEIQLGTMYICDVCGYTVEDEAPDRCPV